MEQEEKIIELRSEEVQEILGRPPSWILRYGIIILFIVIVLFFIGSYFFKYPDVINAEVTLTTENVPATLVAKSSGKITHLLVTDKEIVDSNQVIAIIENPANYTNILMLERFINHYSVTNDSLSNMDSLSNLILGDIQSSYISFIKAYKDYSTFKQLNLTQKKIDLIKRQIDIQNQYYNRLNKQSDYQYEDYKIALNELRRDSTLFESKVLSSSDFEKSKASFIQRKQNYESSKTNLLNVKLQIAQLEQQVIELQLQIDEQQKQYIQAIEQTQNNLLNSIKVWKQQYLFISPIKGKVAFTTIREINQNVSTGDKAFTILPEKETQMIGHIAIPMAGAGKVKEGQRVNIKFYNFPYMEFGMVTAKVHSVSLSTSESKYIIELSFPQGLKTNYGKTLIFRQDMTGSAEIITEDIRLIERFFSPIRAFFKNNQ
jgi:HlyD family secretion protein